MARWQIAAIELPQEVQWMFIARQREHRPRASAPRRTEAIFN